MHSTPSSSGQRQSTSLRNTSTLLGKANGGPIHWTGNFDELQDFEHDLRGPFGGTGLLPDDVFLSGGHDQTLGTPKAGLSDDLDALAAYVANLTTELRSPHRQPNGAMTAEALAGKALFDSELTGCTTCHSCPRLTDSAFLPQQPGSAKMPSVAISASRSESTSTSLRSRTKKLVAIAARSATPHSQKSAGSSKPLSLSASPSPARETVRQFLPTVPSDRNLGQKKAGDNRWRRTNQSGRRGSRRDGPYYG